VSSPVDPQKLVGEDVLNGAAMEYQWNNVVCCGHQGIASRHDFPISFSSMGSLSLLRFDAEEIPRILEGEMGSLPRQSALVVTVRVILVLRVAEECPQQILAAAA